MSIKRFYFILFNSLLPEAINRIILHLSLNALGYFQSIDPEKNGEFGFISSLDKSEKSLYIDVGANTGVYSSYILKNTQSQVLAIEPLKKSFEILTELQSLYPGRLELFNVACGNADIKTLIYSDNESSQLATLSEEVKNFGYSNNFLGHEYLVTMAKLDTIIDCLNLANLQIELIKIDVEGYEREVIEGAMKTISLFRPKYIQLEYNYFHLFRGHTMFMFQSLLPNYDCFQIMPGLQNLKRRDLMRPASNFFGYSNWVFVRRDL